ncbi:MAG: serine hydrolase domain-containing protein [Gemmatimonadaceae bacterium]
MSTTIRLLVLLALLLGGAPDISAQSAPVNVASHPDVLGAQRLFSAWMEGQNAYKGTPGVVVGVVSDQQLIWTQGFGFADIDNNVPMTPEVKFRMASHSKLFAAAAIMQLREEGKLRLDDRVDQHLPWFRMKPAGDDDGPITIEQLVTHASGLQREAGDHWASYEFPTSAQMRALTATREASFAPQIRWKRTGVLGTLDATRPPGAPRVG